MTPRETAAGAGPDTRRSRHRPARQQDAAQRAAERGRGPGAAGNGDREGPAASSPGAPPAS